MNLRKVAGLLVAGGLMVGLLGAGVGAQFTDSATATANVAVGTFGMSITAVAPAGGTAVVSLDGKSVTITCSDVVSSAAGHCLSLRLLTDQAAKTLFLSRSNLARP